jgi:hypothetical protein
MCYQFIWTRGSAVVMSSSAGTSEPPPRSTDHTHWPVAIKWTASYSGSKTAASSFASLLSSKSFPSLDFKFLNPSISTASKMLHRRLLPALVGLVISSLTPISSTLPLDPPPLPPGVDPLQYMGRFGACDAEGVTGFADPCRCFCLQWACMHTQLILAVAGPAEVVCAGQYIIGSRKAGNGFIGAINACIAVRMKDLWLLGERELLTDG